MSEKYHAVRFDLRPPSWFHEKSQSPSTWVDSTAQYSLPENFIFFLRNLSGIRSIILASPCRYSYLHAHKYVDTYAYRYIAFFNSYPPLLFHLFLFPLLLLRLFLLLLEAIPFSTLERRSLLARGRWNRFAYVFSEIDLPRGPLNIFQDLPHSLRTTSFLHCC